MFESLKRKLESFKKGEIGFKDKFSALLSGEVILDEGKIEKVLSELEIILLESDVAFDVVEEISEQIKRNLIGKLNLKRLYVDKLKSLYMHK